MSELKKYRAIPESEVRVLILIAAFSGSSSRRRTLEGRVKLAKLDFLLRYPKYFARVLRHRGVDEAVIASIDVEDDPPYARMIRYRYGPWDPSYYAVLGSLVGRGLIEVIPARYGMGYRATERGDIAISAILQDGLWEDTNRRAKVLKQHLDLAGKTLKDLLYDAIPEMTNADWHKELN